MLRLILIGLLSGLFFSSTFVLNRAMSLDGGHWVWSASLRYGYMIALLVTGLTIFSGRARVGRLLRLFITYWKFWVLAGSIGFGGFYALICFSADYSPGWVIATTWQLTIIASLLVLLFFGRRFPRKTWLFSSLVLLGVLVVNLSSLETLNVKELIFGALPVLLAAFCYPLGNQLVWEAKNGNPRLPAIESPLLENPFNKVLLLSLGSVPFWLLLILVTQPPAPSEGQLINTALVALLSGTIATSLFLYARNKSRRASELAAVDATQSSEVIFAMLGEILILGAPLPNGTALFGMLLVFFGLTLFICFQEATI